MKMKRILLDGGYVEGARWQIFCRVKRNGTFMFKNEIQLRTTEQMNNVPSRKNRSTRRRRGLGYVEICPMPSKGDWVWHHIDNDRVVPVVRFVHENVPHKHGDGKLEGVLG